LNPRDTPTIGVFDSGVGGLTILAELQARLPHERFVYAADNAHFPYGTRTPADVTKWTLATVGQMLATVPVDVIVVACNTASTAALPSLRQKFGIPVVGVVPAVKPAAASTKSGVVGLLATSATVTRPYTDELIDQHARHVTVVRVGSKLLVDLAEAKLRGESVVIEQVRQEIAPFFTYKCASSELGEQPKSVDTIVLGCTHFPLLLDELKQAAQWPVTWLDSGSAVAQRTAALLGERGIQVASGKVSGVAPAAENICFFTSVSDTTGATSIANLLPVLAQYDLLQVRHLPLPIDVQ
jgi:glutamate racemase